MLISNFIRFSRRYWLPLSMAIALAVAEGGVRALGQVDFALFEANVLPLTEN